MGATSARLVSEQFVVGKVAPEIYQRIQNLFSDHVTPRPYWRKETTYAQIYQTWNLEHVPQRTVVDAHLARQTVRETARSLIKQGQRQEAVNLLASTASKALASKEPLVVYESLTEIAGDLALVEPQMASALIAASKQVWENVPKFKDHWVDHGPCGSL